MGRFTPVFFFFLLILYLKDVVIRKVEIIDIMITTINSGATLLLVKQSFHDKIGTGVMVVTTGIISAIVVITVQVIWSVSRHNITYL